MERRRTLTMNWDSLGEDDDDDRFFESTNRISAVAPSDLGGSSESDEDDDFEEARRSFVSCVSSKSFASNCSSHDIPPPMMEDYDMWMTEPGDLKERRKRLLAGMGLASNKSLLASNKNLLKVASAKIAQAVSKKGGDNSPTPEMVSQSPSPSPALVPAPKQEQNSGPGSGPGPSPESDRILLVRSRSDGDIETLSVNTKRRKEELIGPVSKQRLTRTSSVITTPNLGCSYHHVSNPKVTSQKSMTSGGVLGSFFLIKDLDTGKEFIVKEANEKGQWNKLSDVQTGKQLTMEEFEKDVGYSPVVKELMRRQNVHDDQRKLTAANSYLSKSFRYSKRRTASLLKNIKGVANSMSLKVDRDREIPIMEQKSGAAKDSSQWVKVRQTGKSFKEFSALHLCQEIQAHEGSIWTIKFSVDERYLASAGEDGVIHVWEVQECVVHKPHDDLNSVGGTPVHPMASSSAPPLGEAVPMLSKKKGKNSGKKKGDGIPDYAHVPETVFALSEKPICAFKGHQDDVLDLAWSRDQMLLSSSMDKTVRLWDIEKKSCLKMFAHNDYVTCIDFNPMDDNYFLSGSLDAKARIWNIPNRYVVDWIDVKDMVTSACFTPDGQGAVIGSHKGNCRSYTIDPEDYHLEQKDVIEFQNKKKQPKKITGLQFSPNSSELLVTSADSRVRILDGTEATHKFRGFKNTSSQIAAAFSPDGKYIISASEDNQVYIWKRDDPKGKAPVVVQSHEHFQCKDVSVAIPWPGSLKYDLPAQAAVGMPSKRHNSKRFPCNPAFPPATDSPRKEDSNSRKHLPPLPKKNHRPTDSVSSNPDEEPGTNMDPGIGESTESFRGSSRLGDSPSISASNSANSKSFSEGGNQAAAWGIVIVAATTSGEIRVYQNFGKPVKVRQAPNLFRDLT